MDLRGIGHMFYVDVSSQRALFGTLLNWWSKGAKGSMFGVSVSVTFSLGCLLDFGIPTASCQFLFYVLVSLALLISSPMGDIMPFGGR